jgi:hypothetical protein
LRHADVAGSRAPRFGLTEKGVILDSSLWTTL